MRSGSFEDGLKSEANIVSEEHKWLVPLLEECRVLCTFGWRQLIKRRVPGWARSEGSFPEGYPGVPEGDFRIRFRGEFRTNVRNLNLPSRVLKKHRQSTG